MGKLRTELSGQAGLGRLLSCAFEHATGLVRGTVPPALRLPPGLREPGVHYALGAALLFGAAAPLSKLLTQSVSPWLLAGLLYLGSGMGLTLYRLMTRASWTSPPRRDLAWIGLATLTGGILAPVLLLFGLMGMSAGTASLLLNAEGVFTALLAWAVFRENMDRRIALGMAAIVAGAVILSWPSGDQAVSAWPTVLVLLACLGWALDNNFTRRASGSDATWIATTKGLVSGIANCAIAMALGLPWPSAPEIGLALVTGLVTYGVSLVLFVLALRSLGSARTGAYFSTAPFIGATLAVLTGERLTVTLIVAGALMLVGIWLHLTERHEHEHVHEPLEHTHEHSHDEHHHHAHSPGDPPQEPHSHRHVHAYLRHRHPHYPDIHHRHGH